MLLAVNYCCKVLHLRCLWKFWTRLCIVEILSLYLLMQTCYVKQAWVKHLWHQSFLNWGDTHNNQDKDLRKVVEMQNVPDNIIIIEVYPCTNNSCFFHENDESEKLKVQIIQLAYIFQDLPSYCVTVSDFTKDVREKPTNPPVKSRKKTYHENSYVKRKRCYIFPKTLPLRCTAGSSIYLWMQFTCTSFLNLFSIDVPLIYPGKNQNTGGFLIFLGSMSVENLLKVGWVNLRG